jgi:hypothetical protein
MMTPDHEAVDREAVDWLVARHPPAVRAEAGPAPLRGSSVAWTGAILACPKRCSRAVVRRLDPMAPQPRLGCGSGRVRGGPCPRSGDEP